MVKRCKLDANRHGFQGEHELYLKKTCKDAQNISRRYNRFQREMTES